MQAGHQGVGGFGPAVGFQRTPGFGIGPFIKVRAGAEAAAATGEHHHAHRWIGVETVEQAVQVFQRRNVQRIALGSAIEGDPGNACFDLTEQRRLSGHGNPRIIVFGLR
ncbi:hypothetical protein D3C85_1000830 [compost metagenome]